MVMRLRALMLKRESIRQIESVNDILEQTLGLALLRRNPRPRNRNRARLGAECRV